MDTIERVKEGLKDEKPGVLLHFEMFNGDGGIRETLGDDKEAFAALIYALLDYADPTKRTTPNFDGNPMLKFIWGRLARQCDKDADGYAKQRVGTMYGGYKTSCKSKHVIPMDRDEWEEAGAPAKATGKEEAWDGKKNSGAGSNRNGGAGGGYKAYSYEELQKLNAEGRLPRS